MYRWYHIGKVPAFGNYIGYKISLVDNVENVAVIGIPIHDRRHTVGRSKTIGKDVLGPIYLVELHGDHACDCAGTAVTGDPDLDIGGVDSLGRDIGVDLGIDLIGSLGESFVQARFSYGKVADPFISTAGVAVD